MEEKVKLYTEEVELEKIPDYLLLKASRQEVGQLTSYIHELEDKIEYLNDVIKNNEQLTTQDFKELKKDKKYNELKEKLRVQTEKTAELKKENERLWCNNYKNCQRSEKKELDCSSLTQRLQVIDLETNSTHNVVVVDYDENVVIMESLKYGRTRNYIDKVKFLI